MKEKHVQEMRSFSRFYTDVLGLLNTHILASRFSLPEVRIMYELYHKNHSTAKGICDGLHIDKGQLSRILVKLESEKLVTRTRSKDDQRAVQLSLTGKGISEFEILNKASNQQVKQLLIQIDEKNLGQLLLHMNAIQRILSTVK